MTSDCLQFLPYQFLRKSSALHVAFLAWIGHGGSITQGFAVSFVVQVLEHCKRCFLVNLVLAPPSTVGFTIHPFCFSFFDGKPVLL